MQGGLDYAIANRWRPRRLPTCCGWKPKTADLEDAEKFADAIHAKYPDKMLAYNLSPSFNWDTTGMTDEQMQRFPEELGKLGFVFNFITYGGHQIDGLAAEEFATALKQDGMLALARLQRKFRLLESPYRTPQTLVGGPRLDGALMASSGRTAATKAMGKGSTQFQHLVQTEVPPKLLEEWLAAWGEHWQYPAKIRRPTASAYGRLGTAGVELCSTSPVRRRSPTSFSPSLQDRRGRNFLSVRDQNTQPRFRKKRLMTLMQLVPDPPLLGERGALRHPDRRQRVSAQKMKSMGIFSDVHTEIGQIIVAQVSKEGMAEMVKPDRIRLMEMIHKKWPGPEEAAKGLSDEELFRTEGSDELMPSGD